MFKNNTKDVGWKFPVKTDLATGRIKTSSYEDDVAESIKIILLTKKGERMMRPDFGCNISRYMFDILDITTLKQIELEIEEAIKKWEYRIDNLQVQVQEDSENEGRLIINVQYNLLNNPEAVIQNYIYDTKN
jgi:phage baseplate assembly protein W